MKPPIDYRARLVVRGVPDMTKDELLTLAEWLKTTAKIIVRTPKEYAKISTFRLFK